VDEDGWNKKGYAWVIKGKKYGEQPQKEVGIPPIHQFLNKGFWNQNTISRIEKADFEKIHKHVLEYQYVPDKVPLLGREPKCEQELLGAVVCGHKELGTSKVLRIRKAFPDLLVKLRNKVTVHRGLSQFSRRRGLVSWKKPLSAAKMGLSPSAARGQAHFSAFTSTGELRRKGPKNEPVPGGL
jgi:hypothetical protein